MPRTRTLDDLREILFSAAERLEAATDPEKLDAELKRSKAVGELGKVLIETGKLDLAHLKETGDRPGGNFLQSRTAARVGLESGADGPRALAAGRRPA